MAESFWAELPLGLSMTLAKDPVAKGVFDGLSPEERRAFVEGAHDVRSASQMQQYVRSLTGRIQGKKPEKNPWNPFHGFFFCQGVSPQKKSDRVRGSQGAKRSEFLLSKGLRPFDKIGSPADRKRSAGSLYRKKSSKVTGTRRAAARGSAPRRTPREGSSRSGSSPRA